MSELMNINETGIVEFEVGKINFNAYEYIKEKALNLSENLKKVEVTEADIDAEVKELATMYNMTEEGIKQRISVEDLRGELVIQKTVDFLKANN